MVKLFVKKGENSSKMKSSKIARLFNIKEKLACITLDFEKDYDDFIGEFNILHSNKKDISKLINLNKKLKIPLSTFIRTDILVDHPESIPILKELAQDFHSHSHTHSTKKFESQIEILKTVETFKKVFKVPPKGYRAPLGVLYKDDISLLKKNGFLFSSSVFPSYRPSKFNNLTSPRQPFLYNNGILEIPFAVVPKIRSIISLSYLKFLGLGFNKKLYSIFGLPNILIFDSHLHDYIINDKSFNKLPPVLKRCWGRNKHLGFEFYTDFIMYLKSRGYQFVTMSKLYELIIKNNKSK
jgi:peptidoglycan/xylan/chitin deacetylase (PgdA/CDA1 family)